MTTMMETVARAIEAEIARQFRGTDSRIDFALVARAALAAMRTPTEGMIEAACRMDQTFIPRHIWNVMLDAAVAEKPA